jgi:hypothetical protein
MSYRAELTAFLRKFAQAYTIRLTPEEMQDLKVFADLGNDCGLLASLVLVNQNTNEYKIEDKDREAIVLKCQEGNAWSGMNWNSTLGVKLTDLLEDLKSSSPSAVASMPPHTPSFLNPSSLDLVMKEVTSPPTLTMRNTDPLTKTVNLGPGGEAYDRPYTFRGIQDMVKRWASSRDANVDMALEEIQTRLMNKGLKPTNPLMRKLVKLQVSYDRKLAEELYDMLAKKFSETDTVVSQAKILLNLLDKNNVQELPSPQEVTKENLAKETIADISNIKTLCTQLKTKLRKLGLAEEAEQTKVMYACLEDICAEIRKNY